MKATGFDRSQSVLKTVWDAVPSLLLIVIVIGGIVSGVFTATEGAGIAVLYCLILSIIYKSIDFKGFPWYLAQLLPRRAASSCS